MGQNSCQGSADSLFGLVPYVREDSDDAVGPRTAIPQPPVSDVKLEGGRAGLGGLWAPRSPGSRLGACVGVEEGVRG